MKYGYCRVSSVGQNIYGQSMEIQEDEVKKAGAEIIYKDVYTGTRTERPAFQELLEKIKKGDTLIVTKLDRFARSTLEGTKVIQKLFEDGVIVHILNLGIIENTPSGRLIFNIFMSFAEFERELILERMNEGKARAKLLRDDFVEGRPKKYGKKQIEHAIKLKETHTYNEVEELTGISKSTLWRAKKEREKNDENCLQK